MTADYTALSQQIEALCHGETDIVALMATVVCEIHHGHPLSDWTGFYRVVGPELLKIGPYQGGHGCLVIPFARGVCGAAARTGQVQIVPDVEAFPGHIACDAASNSEIVLPVRHNGKIIAVLDIDSPSLARFDLDDQQGLAGLVQLFEQHLARTL